MSQFTRAEHAIDYYEHPTYYCSEPGCDWKQEAEWNLESMRTAEKAGIDHWNATHKESPSVSAEPDPNAFKAARGIAPPVPGSLTPEEAIRKIRGESL